MDPQQPSSLMKILDAYADPPTPPPDNDGLRRALSTFSRENVPLSSSLENNGTDGEIFKVRQWQKVESIYSKYYS